MAFSVVALAIQYKVQLLATLILGYIVAPCIYRRFLQPLAKIPGPFLPAVTKLYPSIVQDKARKVFNRMQAGIRKGVPMDLHHSF